MMEAQGAFAAALQEFGCGNDEDSLLLGEWLRTAAEGGGCAADHCNEWEE
jgi:hypothetical protein